MQLLHVTIQTSHFTDELAFFQTFAGLSIVRDMRPMGRNMVFLANGEGQTQIEIIENPEADASGNAHLSIGFKCGDPETQRERLMAAGFEVTPMVRPMPQVAFFFVKDPAGVNIQFM